MELFWNRYKYTIISFLVIMGGITYYCIDPSRYKIMPKCTIKLMTTLDCPGCGFQRALHAFLHGHIKEAIHYNFFLLFAIPITCIWCINGLYIERTSSLKIRTQLINTNKIIIYIYIVCYSLWFIIRNILSI